MEPFDLKNAFGRKETSLLAALNEAETASHSTTSGDHSELNWVKALGTFLPARYRVAPGFVVDIDGDVSDKQDVIIFDGQYTPMLLEHGHDLYVPAESVYAVLEVKPELNKGYMDYAGAKVASVRRLKRTNGPIVHAGGTIDTPKELFTIIGGVLARNADWSPPWGQPFHDALDALDDLHAMTIGCVLEAGTFQVLDGSTTVDVEHTLMVFLLSLLAQLRALGTAPAMELDLWIDTLR